MSNTLYVDAVEELSKIELGYVWMFWYFVGDELGVSTLMGLQVTTVGFSDDCCLVWDIKCDGGIFTIVFYTHDLGLLWMVGYDWESWSRVE